MRHWHFYSLWLASGSLHQSSSTLIPLCRRPPPCRHFRQCYRYQHIISSRIMFTIPFPTSIATATFDIFEACANPGSLIINQSNACTIAGSAFRSMIKYLSDSGRCPSVLLINSEPNIVDSGAHERQHLSVQAGVPTPTIWLLVPWQFASEFKSDQ